MVYLRKNTFASGGAYGEVLIWQYGCNENKNDELWIIDL